MTYTVDVDPEARDQIEALPPGLLEALAEVLTMLELVPWSCPSYHAGNPDGALRQVVFEKDNDGVAVYMILEDQRRVDLLRVMWWPA